MTKPKWQKDEEEQIKRLLSDDKEWDKRLNSIYQEAIDDIQDIIDRAYSHYGHNGSLDIDRLLQQASPSDKARLLRDIDKLQDSDDIDADAKTRLKTFKATMHINRSEWIKAAIGVALVGTVMKLLSKVASKLTIDYESEVKRQSGILNKKPPKTLTATAKQVTAERFYGVQFSKRIWGDTDQLKARLDQLLSRAAINGERATDLAKQLQKEFGVTQYQAERILRTESTRMYSRAQMDTLSHYNVKWYNLVTEASACRRCLDVAASGPYEVRDATPGDNMPPMHANCRCSVVAYDKKSGKSGEEIEL